MDRIGSNGEGHQVGMRRRREGENGREGKGKEGTTMSTRRRETREAGRSEGEEERSSST